jgi:hypothetical protein
LKGWESAAGAFVPHMIKEAVNTNMARWPFWFHLSAADKMLRAGAAAVCCSTTVRALARGDEQQPPIGLLSAQQQLC